MRGVHFLPISPEAPSPDFPPGAAVRVSVFDCYPVREQLQRQDYMLEVVLVTRFVPVVSSSFVPEHGRDWLGRDPQLQYLEPKLIQSRCT